MGYSTQFSGRFDFVGDVPLNVIESMNDILGVDTRDRTGTFPGCFCGWILTKDNKGLKWDGEEKFYQWEEWLNWIIRTILLPNRVNLKGHVTYQGDDVEDAGFIDVLEGCRVVVTKLPTVADEYAELKEFRDFVLNSEYKDELLAAWKIEKGRDFDSDS